jgi:hypothetical protein
MLARLTVWQKLAAICVAFSLPTLLLTIYLVKVSDKDVTLARHELCGDQYNRRLFEILNKVQQHRNLAATFLLGEAAAKEQVAALETQIDGVFGEFEALARESCIDANDGDTLATGRLLGDLTSRWQELKLSSSLIKPEAVDAAHTRFVSVLLSLYSHVGDSSKLILDPDLDTYHVIEVTLVKLPEAAKRLADLLSYGRAPVSRRAVTADEKTELIAQASALEVNLQETDHDINDAYGIDNYYDAARNTLKAAVDTDLQNYQTLAHRFLAILQHQVIKAEPIAVTPAEYNAAGVVALESLYRFFKSATAWQDRELQARASYHTSRRDKMLAIIGVVLLFSIGLVAKIIRSITRPLTEAVLHLTNASQQILATTIQQAAGAREQAAAVSETATTADEITQTAQQAAQRAGSMGEAARRTAEVGEAGN